MGIIGVEEVKEEMDGWTVRKITIMGKKAVTNEMMDDIGGREQYKVPILTTNNLKV